MLELGLQPGHSPLSQDAVDSMDFLIKTQANRMTVPQKINTELPVISKRTESRD